MTELNDPIWPRAKLIGFTVPYDSPPLTEPLDIVEFAGRWDYGPKSIAKLGDRTVIERWLKGGEESMIEMVDAVFLITCSRVVSHELVRHRIASYQQESQRFVAYEDEEVDDMFYFPPEIQDGSDSIRDAYRDHMAASLHLYKRLRAANVSKQIARYVFPNATRTTIIAKMNLREWRHVLRLRMHTSAQPEIQNIMRAVHQQLQEQFGTVLFPDDIAAERAAR